MVLTLGLAFCVPAVLPGFKLRHDRVFCAHDLEGVDRPHWQREPDRGGAEVSVALRPATEEQGRLSESPHSGLSLERALGFSLLMPFSFRSGLC